MTTSRRHTLLAGAALLGSVAGLARAQERPSFSGAAQAARSVLLAQGEAALQRGDPNTALEVFERAALMRHAADAEMGIVRAMVQDGGYRRALAFAAHAAGAHHDAPAASALYAWLLAAGGQGAFAQRVLDASVARSNDDALLGATRRALAQPMPIAPAELLEAPQRAAPHAVVLGDDAPRGLRGLASGTLIDGGRGALVPIGTGDAPTWLRNGLGQMVRAELESASPVLGVALMRLLTPLDPGPGAPPADTDPFAGSAGVVVAIAPGDGEPAWPWLFDGFVGGADPGRPLGRRLLFDLPGPCGGVVFDASGRWCGIALAEARTRRWLPLSALREAFGAALGPSGASSAPHGRMAADEVYERALRQVVQALA